MLELSKSRVLLVQKVGAVGIVFSCVSEDSSWWIVDGG